MLMAVTILTLLSRIPYGITLFRSCIPNTQFLLNGRLCNCNSVGQSNDASCQTIVPRQSCLPGQIIWEECSQCICQENGKLLCTNTECADDNIARPQLSTVRSGSEMLCTPLRSYYVNCSLCVCPASGKLSEARCATDSSCVLKELYTSLDTIPQNICIPKVLYLFSCLHCLCSDDGLFIKSKCTETCSKPPESTKTCIPKSFYKSGCNICRCPDNGKPQGSVCSKSTCTKQSKVTSLNVLRNVLNSCPANTFTKPRCFYCECNAQGTVNEHTCLEQECLQVDVTSYDSVKSTCSKGEMVSTCMECFCPRTKLTMEKYCTRSCSSQNKIAILESVLKEKLAYIDRTIIKETMGTDSCDPNSLYLDQGRYCLCSADGNTNLKLCTSVVENMLPTKPSKVFNKKDIHRNLDFNISCEPNTYVEFGCNSCYCTKSGKIDPKWCTADDCEEKKLAHEGAHKGPSGNNLQNSTKCVPGAVSIVKCNFCICGSSGLLSQRACTKNVCNAQQKNTSDELRCEPSSYFTVDCNICYCQSNGIKNVDKCTKNQCETNFLRSDSCTPGDMFSHDCNICVCPPNGEKKDKICTNRTCSDNDTPWKKIFKISQNLLSNQVADDKSRKFEPCYPGEEFQVGCKVCLCPDLGLKEYASCSDMLCDGTTTVSQQGDNDLRPVGINEDNRADLKRQASSRSRRKLAEGEPGADCTVFNITDSSEIRDCTPGSEYIIRCQICICPYMGSINNFCREMPLDRYCEQAFPGYNYASLQYRRGDGGNATTNSTHQGNIKHLDKDRNTTTARMVYPRQFYVPHNHTKYECKITGKMEDECFICECDNNVLIREHCYKSDSTNCTKVNSPSFINIKNKLNV